VGVGHRVDASTSAGNDGGVEGARLSNSQQRCMADCK